MQRWARLSNFVKKCENHCTLRVSLYLAWENSSSGYHSKGRPSAGPLCWPLCSSPSSELIFCAIMGWWWTQLVTSWSTASHCRLSTAGHQARGTPSYSLESAGGLSFPSLRVTGTGLFFFPRLLSDSPWEQQPLLEFTGLYFSHWPLLKFAALYSSHQPLHDLTGLYSHLQQADAGLRSPMRKSALRVTWDVFGDCHPECSSASSFSQSQFSVWPPRPVPGHS